MSPATLYVLDCPEFRGLVDAAVQYPEVSTRRVGHHVAIEGPELRIKRADTGLIDAVWFGALTGGIHGSVLRFDQDELHLISGEG